MKVIRLKCPTWSTKRSLKAAEKWPPSLRFPIAGSLTPFVRLRYHAARVQALRFRTHRVLRVPPDRSDPRYDSQRRDRG